MIMPITTASFSHFDKEQDRVLREQIAHLQGSEAILSYYQLLGFLFAIACSPESIKPSEWFDLIWLNDEPQFDDETQARQFYKQVVALAEHVSELTRQRRFLPFSARYSERWQHELAEWSEGLLFGHQYLEDLWLVAQDDLDDQTFIEEVDACLNLAATFADVIGAKQLSFDEGMELTDEHLPEAYAVFWKLLGTYATVGSIWSEGAWDFDAEQLFLALEPVPHEAPCPCGSGQIFSRCCLH
ncbi:MAG: yecA family protein [Oceanicoccus sp.]|jgi:yecA family protein